MWGTFVQLAFPLCLGAWCLYKRQTFLAYVCLYAAAQGIVTLVSISRTPRPPGWAGLAPLLGLTEPSQNCKERDAVRLIGLFACLVRSIHARVVVADTPVASNQGITMMRLRGRYE